MNILIRDSASLIPDKNIPQSGEIFISHMEILPLGMNNLIKDSASFVLDQIMNPSGKISLFHMDTHDWFY